MPWHRAPYPALTPPSCPRLRAAASSPLERSSRAHLGAAEDAPWLDARGGHRGQVPEVDRPGALRGALRKQATRGWQHACTCACRGGVAGAVHEQAGRREAGRQRCRRWAAPRAGRQAVHSAHALPTDAHHACVRHAGRLGHRRQLCGARLVERLLAGRAAIALVSGGGGGGRRRPCLCRVHLGFHLGQHLRFCQRHCRAGHRAGAVGARRAEPTGVPAGQQQAQALPPVSRPLDTFGRGFYAPGAFVLQSENLAGRSCSPRPRAELADIQSSLITLCLPSEAAPARQQAAVSARLRPDSRQAPMKYSSSVIDDAG